MRIEGPHHRVTTGIAKLVERMLSGYCPVDTAVSHERGEDDPMHRLVTKNAVGMEVQVTVEPALVLFGVNVTDFVRADPLREYVYGQLQRECFDGVGVADVFAMVELKEDPGRYRAVLTPALGTMIEDWLDPVPAREVRDIAPERYEAAVGSVVVGDDATGKWCDLDWCATFDLLHDAAADILAYVAAELTENTVARIVDEFDGEEV